MKKFLRENAPLLVVGVLVVIVVLFIPLAPKNLWKLGETKKGPFREALETTEGRKEIVVTLVMHIETPTDFVFRASPLERLRGESFPVEWTLRMEGAGSATLPCFESDDRACAFKIGAANRDTLSVQASDCQASSGDLVCRGRSEMKASKYLDISRADSIVRPVD